MPPAGATPLTMQQGVLFSDVFQACEVAVKRLKRVCEGSDECYILDCQAVTATSVLRVCLFGLKRSILSPFHTLHCKPERIQTLPAGIVHKEADVPMLHRLYSSISLLQSLFNARLNTCVNKAFSVAENLR